MYFESAKKNYYHFPSAKSVERLDNRMYFPEKPAHAKEDSHYQHSTKDYMPDREQYYNV